MRSGKSTLAKSPGARHPELGPTELLQLHRHLEREWRQLLEAYRRDVAAERSVPFGDAEDNLDHVVKEEFREDVSALAETERERLRQVEEALERIADGSYGFCLETGAAIPLARLHASPRARYTLAGGDSASRACA